jgi:hypothetical protein
MKQQVGQEPRIGTDPRLLVTGNRFPVVLMLGALVASIQQKAQEPETQITLTDDINTGWLQSLETLQKADATQYSVWAGEREKLVFVAEKHQGEPTVRLVCETVIATFVGMEKLTTAHSGKPDKRSEVPGDLLNARNFAEQAFGQSFAEYLQHELLEKVVPFAAQMYGDAFGSELQRELQNAFQAQPVGSLS